MINEQAMKENLQKFSFQNPKFEKLIIFSNKKEILLESQSNRWSQEIRNSMMNFFYVFDLSTKIRQQDLKLKQTCFQYEKGLAIFLPLDIKNYFFLGAILLTEPSSSNYPEQLRRFKSFAEFIGAEFKKLKLFKEEI